MFHKPLIAISFIVSSFGSLHARSINNGYRAPRFEKTKTSPPGSLVRDWTGSARCGHTLVMRLKPAAPTVDRNTVWTDTVKRGNMIRQVRGLGTLVPREDRIRSIPAETDGTVVSIFKLPGALVHPDTVILRLTNPQLMQEAQDAALQLNEAQADYHNTQVSLESSLMDRRATAADIHAQYQQAQLQARTDQALYKLGVISGLSYSDSQGKADALTTREDLEKQRSPSTRKLSRPSSPCKRRRCSRRARWHSCCNAKSMR